MTVGITLRSSASVVCGGSSGLLAPCVFVLLVASIAQAQIPAHKVVLIINEVGLAHPASALVTEQVMSRLAADPRYQTEFYIEPGLPPVFSGDLSGGHRNRPSSRLWGSEDRRNRCDGTCTNQVPVSFFGDVSAGRADRVLRQHPSAGR